MYQVKRISHTDKGIFGVFIDPAGMPLCVTLERPWRGNEKNVSCIVDGEYAVIKHHGNRFKDVWRLCDTPGRSYILFHAGNTIEDTQGCILVGLRYYTQGIADSKDALNHLRKVLPDQFTVKVSGLKELGIDDSIWT